MGVVVVRAVVVASDRGDRGAAEKEDLKNGLKKKREKKVDGLKSEF